jgi:hypothetical protein
VLHNLFLTPMFAVLAFVVLASVSGWLASQPTHAAAVLLGLVVLDAMNLPIEFKFGISLYPADLFFVALSIACLIRFSLFCSPGAVPTAWWIIGVVQLGLAVWGVKTIGTLAGVDARGHFYLWVTVLYFCSVKWSDRMVARVVNLWIFCAFCLCLLAYYRWINSALDPKYEQEIMALDTTGVRFRVLSSSAALVIAVGTLGLMFRLIKGTLAPSLWLLIPLQLAAVVLLQHRSVWVSMFVGAAFLLWAKPGKGKRRSALPALALMLIPVAIAVAIPARDDGMLASVRSSADHAMSLEEGTMVGRTLYWNELLAHWAASGEPSTYLVGRPYGSGFNPDEYDDRMKGQDMVPHNHFIHILYRGGLIGLLATLAVFLRTWRAAAAESKRSDKAWAHFLSAALPALFAYFIPYWATYESGLLLGVAIGYLGIEQRVRLSNPAAASVVRFAPRRLPASFQSVRRLAMRSRMPPE